MLGIFLLRFSKPPFSNILAVTLLKMEAGGPLYLCGPITVGKCQGFLLLGSLGIVASSETTGRFPSAAQVS